MTLSVNLSAYAANGGSPLTYSAGTAYVNGDVVTSGGVQYKCKASTTGNAPPNSTYWVTIVEKTIGGVTRDYQSIASWIAACPDLITNNQIWKGLIYKEGSGVTEWAASIDLSNKNTITSADNFIWLEPASGQGFIDNVGVRTNALSYNNVNGVAINAGTATVYGGDRCGLSFVRGLQLRGAFGISNSATNLNASQCIVDWGSPSASFAAEFGSLRAVNCAFRSAQSSGTFIAARGSAHHYTNCTFLGAGGTSSVFSAIYANTITLKGNVFIGFSSVSTSGTYIVAANSTYNATDLAAFEWTGTGNITSLVAANQLENLVTPFDMRVKSGSGLVAGVRIQAETDDYDISRYARSTTTPTIGAWEFSGVTPPVTTTNYTSAISRGMFTGIERGIV
jgi:hypothetical protein